MGHVVENVVQQSFRARNDNGSETSATWKAPLNSDIGMSLGVPFRVRFLIEETAGGSANNYNYVLQYSLNGGAWTLATLSTPVHATPSAFVANGTPTTQQLGAGSFVAGLFDSNASVSNISISSQQTEMEYCLLLDSAQMSGGDTVQLRVTNSGTALNGYTNTPSISVAVIGNISTTLEDTTAALSGQMVPVATIDATLSDTTAAAEGFHPGTHYVEDYYVENYYVLSEEGPVGPGGDLEVTLDDTVASIGATRFPAYWIKIAGTVTIQTGETSFYAILQVDASNNGGWWFDEVKATVNGGANQLTNGRFETGDKTDWLANPEQDGTVVTTGSPFEPPGVYTLQIEADPTLPQLQSSDSFPVTEGDQVYVEAWAFFYGGVNSNGKATGRTKNASGDTIRTVAIAQTAPDPDVVTGEWSAQLDSTVAAVDGHHDPLHVGDIAATLDDTIVASSGVHGAAGDVAATLADTTASVSAEHVVLGTVTVALNDTGADVSTVHGVVGTVAGALGDTALVASGAYGAAGTLTVSIDDTTAAASGSHGVAAVLDASLDATVATVEATFGDEPVADIDVTLADTTAAVQARHGYAAALVATLGDTALVASGVHGVEGTLTAALGDTTAAMTGVQAATGELAVTLDDTTLAAIGAQAVTGALTVTTEDTTASVNATVGDEPTGDIAVTLDDTTTVAAGSHGVAGTHSAQLDDTTTAVAGEHVVAGTLTAQLENTVADIQGTVEAAGQSIWAAQLDDTATTAQASHGVSGSLAASLGDLTLEIVAVSGVAGSHEATLDDTVAVIEGSYEDSTRTATIAVTLDDTAATIEAAHYEAVTGDISATLDDTEASVDAVFTGAASGAIAATLEGTQATVTTVHGSTGTIVAVLDGVMPLFTFKSGTIGVPENPGVYEVSRHPGIRGPLILVGARDVSKQYGVNSVANEPGVR